MKEPNTIPIAVTSQTLDSTVDKERSAKQAKKMGMSERLYSRFYEVKE